MEDPHLLRVGNDERLCSSLEQPSAVKAILFCERSDFNNGILRLGVTFHCDLRQGIDAETCLSGAIIRIGNAFGRRSKHARTGAFRYSELFLIDGPVCLLEVLVGVRHLRDVAYGFECIMSIVPMADRVGIDRC